MALGHSPQIVTNGLVFYVDPSNSRSYSGFGNTIYNMVNSSIGGTFVGYTSNPIDNTFTRSIIFDGSSNYLNFPNAVNDTLSSFTIETVVKVAATNKKQAIISTFGSNLGWGLEILDNTGSNKFNFFGFTSAGVATGSQSGSGVLLNQTYHVMGVFNASRSMDVYVNGVLSGTLPTSFSSITKSSSVNLRLGEDTDAQNVFFQGNLYFAKIYNYALSATEILQNYNAIKKKFNPDENIVRDGLVLNIDPAKSNSYPGTGNTIYDLSGFGNTGILTNGPAFSASNNGSIFFDGSNDYINIPDSPSLNPSRITLSCWVRFNSFTDNANLISKGYTIVGSPYVQYTLKMNTTTNNNLYGFEISNNGTNAYIYTTTPLFTNRYYNLTATYDGTTLRIYKDGIQDSVIASSSGSIASYATPVQIGRWGTQGTQYLNGNVSQALIYNRALTQQEILQNYNATKNRFINALPPVRNGLVLEYDATIVASYPGTGTTWYDISGNNYNGTLTNGPVLSSTGTSSSIAFDGTNDYVDMNYPSQINTGSPITLALWAKWITTGSTTATIQTLVDNNYQTAYIDGPGSIGFFIQDRPDLGGVLEWGAKPGIGITRCTSTFVVGDGKWHYITATNDGSNSILYVDGAQSGLARTAAGIGDSQPFINLGRWRFAQTRYLNGNIADFRIYNRALSAYEVKQNFDYYRTRYGV